MADNLNPSSASEISGNDNPSANATDGQGEQHPKNEVKPRNRQPRKWFGFTKAKWREIASFAVLVPWIFNDLFDTHNFTKLLLLALSILIALAIVCSFFTSRTKGIAIFLLALVPVSTVVWINASPEKPPQSHLYLGLSTDGPASNVIWLTNDFLISTGKSVFISKSSPWITIPVLTTQTNFSLWLQLINDSKIDADSPEVRMVIDGKIECFAESGWSMVREEDRSDFTWRDSALLSGEPIWLPRIIIPPIPTDNCGLGPVAPASILIRSKNSPPKIISFIMIFAPETPEKSKSKEAIHFNAFPSKFVKWGSNTIEISYPDQK